MKKELQIHVSPATNTIFCGNILKHGVWAKNKQDVTIDALVAVAEHVVKFGAPVEIRKASGELEYTITATKEIKDV